MWFARIVGSSILLALCLTLNARSCVSTFSVGDRIGRLQSYLRVRTDHGTPDYSGAIARLSEYFAELLPNASLRTQEFVRGKPVLVATLAGSDPSLSAVLLNSHTDVVPAETAKWTYDPFEAEVHIVDGQRRVYARGSQDMKSVGLQYIEALADLTRTGWTPRRTVHLSFVPDEEIGGFQGMGLLVKSELWRSMRVGVALDEGVPNGQDMFHVFNGERQTWWIVVRVKGAPGHGATFPQDSSTTILHKITANAMAFRERQYERLQNGVDMGDVVGLNLVFMKSGIPDEAAEAGHAMNVIPSIAEAGFDIRVPQDVDPKEMEKEIESWMNCSKNTRCPGVTYKYVNKVIIPYKTPLDKDKYWFAKAFFDGLNDAGIGMERIVKGTFIAATDARYVREVGIPAIGFSPITRTPMLLHKHDEYITEDGYLEGCRIYSKLIKRLADSDGRMEKTKMNADKEEL